MYLSCNISKTSSRTSSWYPDIQKQRKARAFIKGGEWYLENAGLGKFWQDLEISEAFLISLEVSFLHGLFLLFLSLETFYQRVSGSDF